ncbi:MAG TPA: twin-arginine translocase TatA/TatE family subunit, partial [Chloroflexota bacterium]
MPSLGPTELIIILVIVLVLFGGSRIGELGKALGMGIKEFKSSVRDEETIPASAEKDKVARPAPSTTTASAAAPTTPPPAPPTASTAPPPAAP